MNIPRPQLLVFFALAWVQPPAVADPANRKFDVVIVSGSSGGVGAAIGAARLGVTVALIEDTPVLGGMLSNGISNIDSFSYQSLSGVFEEFRKAVMVHYQPLFGKDPLFVRRSIPPSNIDGRSFPANESVLGGRWEPHVADGILKAMAAGYPNLEVFYRRFATGVLMDGNRVIGVTTATDAGESIRFLARIVVDATHEGDIAAWAGVKYRIGREARSELEPHAGQVHFYDQTGELLPDSSGRQDDAIVSAGLRLCIQNYPNQSPDHVLAVPPPEYNKADYLHTSYTGTPSVPSGKAEMNCNPMGNELQGLGLSWTNGNRAERKALYDRYKNHALGFLYFLQHERGLTALGLAADEFVDNGNLPYRIYVRESRRIEGEATMTEADINPYILARGLTPPLCSTSIGIGNYPIDSKPAYAKTDLSMPDKGDGDFVLANVASAFQVPYGAIVPKKVDGLLVPVALSATHVAFSAIRLDPTWTVLGQAAGIAAALCVQRGCTLRELPIGDLQLALLQQNLKLAFYWDVDADRPDFRAIQMLTLQGVVSGDSDRQFHPDGSLTRSDAAQLLFRAFRLWPSVSNAHFSDVTHEHPAFREIETLYDHGLLEAFGFEPQWPRYGGYNPARDSGFKLSSNFGLFSPEKPVTNAEWSRLVGLLRSGTVWPPKPGVSQSIATTQGPGDALHFISRGEACIQIWRLLSKG